MTNTEIVGIQCSKLSGALEPKNMRLTFLRAILSNCCILIFAICIYTRADLVLISMGFDHAVATIAHHCVLCMIPGLIIQAFNEMLKAYLISLKYLKPFFWLNLGLILSYPILGYLFLWVLDIGVYGYGIISFIRELVGFCVLFIYLKKCTKEEENNFQGESLKEVMAGWGKHWMTFFKMFMSIFTPYAAWEINTLLLGQLKDNNFQAAWANLQSLCGLGYCMGGGMSQRARTEVNM